MKTLFGLSLAFGDQLPKSFEVTMDITGISSDVREHLLRAAFAAAEDQALIVLSEMEQRRVEVLERAP